MRRPQTLEVVVKHIKIDDEAIDAGNSFEIIDPVWYSVVTYEGEERYEESLKCFSKEQRKLLAISWHISEVCNGGHDQFYYNSTGIVWRDALAGYKAVGLTEAASILQRSADRMGGNPSLDRADRQDQLDSKQPSFGDLDDEFFELQRKVNFEEAMMTYIKQHRASFYFDGEVKKLK